MDQHDIDRLVSDIQEYLNQVEEHRQGDEVESQEEGNKNDLESGFFIPDSSRTRMECFLKYSRFVSYAVEVLTIALFTAGVLAPFRSWPRTLMFLLGVLLFGIFTITVLLSLQTRIRLLLQIEANTRRIALSKARIAEALEKIRIE
ncbi:MAG: hypothetical protein JSV16_11065 [Candidatus Hydrogenedentota bacterium]|nr:MAG: hypothetical protein JSV16_11065 [Candidatus Hydrogenedentota bacterium]